MSPQRTRQARLDRPGGFTLIEVLAALLLIAIVLPVIMRGITLAGAAASDSRRRTEAAGLAESKLAEIIATGQWQDASALSGDFGTDWPDYRWEMTVQPWTGDLSGSLEQVDLRVLWTARSRQQSITLSTLRSEQ